MSQSRQVASSEPDASMPACDIARLRTAPVCTRRVAIKPRWPVWLWVASQSAIPPSLPPEAIRPPLELNANAPTPQGSHFPPELEP